MKKIGIIGSLFAGLSAAFGKIDGKPEPISIVPDRKQQVKAEAPTPRKKKPTIQKGQQLFEVNGVNIYALNQENAIRKYNNLTSKNN